MNKTNTNNGQPRLSNGRFASNSSMSAKRSTPTSKRTGASTSVNVKSSPKSTFIQNMFEAGGLVHVTMTRYPKTMYSYRPTASGLTAVKNAMAKGAGLGEVYNQHLRGREISRTIYK